MQSLPKQVFPSSTVRIKKVSNFQLIIIIYFYFIITQFSTDSGRVYLAYNYIRFISPKTSTVCVRIVKKETVFDFDMLK